MYCKYQDYCQFVHVDTRCEGDKMVVIIHKTYTPDKVECVCQHGYLCLRAGYKHVEVLVR